VAAVCAGLIAGAVSAAPPIDSLKTLTPGAVSLRGGMLGDRLSASVYKRLQIVDERELLDTFERRDIPHQEWQGEHAGKFLHAATLAWKETGDLNLKEKIDRVAARLIRTQKPDGYLGGYPDARRWTSWDVWVHKYNLIGLLTYHEYTGSPSALKACRKAGDLLIKTFGDRPGQLDLNDKNVSSHQGMASGSVLEPMVRLYRVTGDVRYLDFAKYVVVHYDAPGGPAVISTLLREKSVQKVANGKAYEMLSVLNGALDLYRVTGDSNLLKAAEIAWQDITANRRYITGTTSSFEHFQADHALPNKENFNIGETCVTVTWEQLNIRLLSLTGDAKYADELERTVYNHLIGAQAPTGDKWSYYTPLEGRKPMGNSTSCCISSGPRGLALIPTFAAMTSRDGGVVMNLYNHGSVRTTLPSGAVRIVIKGNYPLDGKVSLQVFPAKDGTRFPMRLFIPAWTESAEININGKPWAEKAEPGCYARILRPWKRGDTVTLNIAVGPRFIIGDHTNEGKAAAMWGPLVLALDTARNPAVSRPGFASWNADYGFELELKRLPGAEPVWETEGRVNNDADVGPLYLTPFANAGGDGKSRFVVWLSLPGRAPVRKADGSLFFAGDVSVSRRGNQEMDIADDDFQTFRVTWNLEKRDEDWFAVSVAEPVRISRVVFGQGRYYHDGGWFDVAGGGKPRVQVMESPNGQWKTIATLDSYPDTTSTDPKSLADGQEFEARFPPVSAVAVRVIGRPACGDDPKQNFASCSEVQAFAQ